jgi:hypothetical protein
MWMIATVDGGNDCHDGQDPRARAKSCHIGRCSRGKTRVGRPERIVVTADSTTVTSGLFLEQVSVSLIWG